MDEHIVIIVFMNIVFGMMCLKIRRMKLVHRQLARELGERTEELLAAEAKVQDIELQIEKNAAS